MLLALQYPPLGRIYPLQESAFDKSAKKFTIEACDIADTDLLGAGRFALIMIGAVSKALQVHALHHGASTPLTLDSPLGQKGQMADLGADKEHC